MRTLWLMLMVLVVEYTFGASDINTALTNNDGGNYMKIRISDFTILPNNFGKLDIEGINLTADDMLSTISSFDKLYDYKVYRAFNEQFIVVAYIKGESRYYNIIRTSYYHNGFREREGFIMNVRIRLTLI